LAKICNAETRFTITANLTDKALSTDLTISLRITDFSTPDEDTNRNSISTTGSGGDLGSINFPQPPTHSPTLRTPITPQPQSPILYVQPQPRPINSMNYMHRQDSGSSSPPLNFRITNPSPPTPPIPLSPSNIIPTLTQTPSLPTPTDGQGALRHNSIPPIRLAPVPEIPSTSRPRPIPPSPQSTISPLNNIPSSSSQIMRSQVLPNPTRQGNYQGWNNHHRNNQHFISSAIFDVQEVRDMLSNLGPNHDGREENIPPPPIYVEREHR